MTKTKYRKYHWINLVVIAIVAIWLLGLMVFIRAMPTGVEQPDTSTDAIIILTGGSERISTGIDLLKQGKAKRMLISGVGGGVNLFEVLAQRNIKPEDVQDIWPLIDLGYEAKNTRGNAQEAANWMREHGFKTLRLVTANYHILRSAGEFKREMPEVQIIMHPVFPEHVAINDWWRKSGTKMLLITEYHKFLASQIRQLF